MEKEKLSENRKIENKNRGKNKNFQTLKPSSFISAFEESNIKQFSNNLEVAFKAGDSLRVEEVQKIFTEKKTNKWNLFQV